MVSDQTVGATGSGRLAWVAIAALGLYLVVLFARLGDIAHIAGLNADAASGPVIASLFGERGSDGVVLGNYPWYEALGILRATKPLPAHRVIWEYGPFVVMAITIGATCGLAARVVGRWAGGIALVALAAAGPQLLDDLDTWAFHGLTWLHVVVLAVFCVWVSTRERPPLALAVIVGLFTAPAVASDNLLYVAGIGPLLIAAGMAVAKGAPRRVLRGGAICAGVATVGGLLIGAIARGDDVRAAHALPIRLADPGDWPHHVVIAGKALAALGNGDVFSTTLGASAVTHAVCIALWALAVVAAARACWDTWRDPGAAPPRVAYVTFWATSALALLVAFVCSTAPRDINSARYLVGVLLAVASLAPLTLVRTRRLRLACEVAVTVLALAGVAALVRGEMTDNPARFPDGAEAAAVAKVARRYDVSYGYGGYWTVTPISWRNHLAPRLYPVRECGPDHALCRYDFHTLGAWYQPKPGRSMLVIDSENRLEQVTAASEQLGRPLATAHQGGLTILVYPRDIAEHVGPPIGG
jgi:hypothetical protein